MLRRFETPTRPLLCPQVLESLICRFAL